MNKYKMITICSLSIVCMLILSLLLPLTTSANDEESINLKLHYEKATVTVNVAVNSKIYTGVICKYIEVDNVLEYDDLEYQTKEKGQSINLNKLENDNYTSTIENVSKRYIVVYVSIGNCSICDYIDTKKDTTQETEKTETKKDETPVNDQNNKQDNGQQDNSQQDNNQQDNNQPNNNQQDSKVVSEDSITDNNANSNNKSDGTTADVVESEPNGSVTANDEIPETTTSSNEAPKTENETTPATPSPEQEETTSTTVDNTASKSEENTNNNKNNTNKTQGTDKTSNNKSTNNNNTSANNNAGVVDKDSINTDDFEEIESIDKTKSASTVDSNMPQTGENDTAKFVGIIVFSIIGLVSFYKYKESSKKVLE